MIKYRIQSSNILNNKQRPVFFFLIFVFQFEKNILIV